MLRINKLIVFFVIILFSLLGKSQSCVISGIVNDQNGNPLSYVSVVATFQQNQVEGALTDSLGRYLLKVGQAKKPYQLHFTYMGCETQTIDIMADVKKVTAETVVLRYSSEMLSGIGVVGTADAPQYSVDRVVFTPNSQNAGMKGSVLDVLKEVASVTIDNEGNITLRGNSNVLILVNGIPTTMTSLSALPAANVKQVEVVHNPNSQYDAEGTGGIINIVTYEQAKGLSGLVSANYGFNHFVNGNVSLNYNQKKYALRFSYNTKFEDDNVVGTLNRKLYATNTELQQEFRTLRKVFNTNIGLGGTFRINPRNTLTMDAHLRLPRLNTQQEFHNTYETSQLEHSENRNSNVSWNRENVDGVISYRHVFRPDTSEMTLTASVSKIWGHRPSFYFLEGDSIGKSNSGGNPLNTFAQGDFFIKKKYGTWKAGAKFTYRQNNIFHEFYNVNETGWEYSNELSNDLTHREFIPAAYMLFSSSKKKALTWEAGVRVEYSAVKLHSEKSEVNQLTHHIFIAPSAALEYKIKSKRDGVGQTISAAWSNRISRPTYPQLNPYLSMIDAHTFEQGNMFLKPETSSQLEFMYALKHKKLTFNASVYCNHRANNITQMTDLRNENLVITYVNGKYELTTGIDLVLKAYCTRWLEVLAQSSTWFADTKGTSEEMDLANRGVTNSSNLRLDFKPIKGMNIQLQYFLTTPQYFPQFTTELAHYMNIGISQKFLKNSLTISVLLTDVFNTNQWNIHAENRVYRLSHLSTNKSRMLWLGISYNFNSFRPGKAGKPAAEEQGRLRLGL